ncbi:disease resistance protein RUN1-like isoform X1 [Rosa rugosa]|uniref:disease resistance protein RUN1-like isoform X1 n=1 Tax=Rosa rugosa TaxID=74645 RepID=UPI002B4096C6|nr:disease resistance protein RUN1-like isoform X1 [Rosa rugosa]XP_061995834.1 disease resistance protein RUN1-like isoform X1 [Rosa rugosa]XP_061995835.1 disease resistance protein RUN1-like isoform X1 [Rosa rugosa]XP_061995836.1 disease resistance protein RUN1-like isoform X1 [Rosa rugosa]XP_061995837.1 disease resistance protein RUN1-like isoform X1 [Rosa rugosa]XP_061995838.1 disease resistance protein RUN1-like isoform X1 [Rosa rugosa]
MALVRYQLEAASPSTSASPSQFSYDVFLSFRGEDTRKNFTDHLYTALTGAGLRTFRDDDELPRGEDIKPELERAIQLSRSSVIVFSKDYASSKWCLDELCMILQHRTASDHIVLPVFYDVDPSHIRKQTGSVAIAFARHQKKSSLEKLNAWRTALAQVADLAGMVLKNEADGHESKFIQKIVKVIEEKLCRPRLSVASHLIGIHDRVENINSWLQDGSSGVGVYLIYGIGGIGKTTIAQVVYNLNFRRFEGRSFLENIRETSQGTIGLIQLQRQLLSDILGGRKVKIQSVSQGISKIRYAINSKKVLIVLDDVDHMSQFNAILRMRDSFHPGSKIIVTSRDVGILEACQADKVHNVKPLNRVESLELFSRHAFGQDHPIEGYRELSQSVVRHSGGLPLALQTLGSSLCGKSTDVWESALKKLRAIPNNEILHQLRISYDSLPDDHDKDLFLHIACFFIGKGKDVIVRILDECEFYTIVGIQNLIDRCLVTLDENNVVKMHQMIRDMGREIVRLESKYPEKRSRLWHHKDSFNVLKEKSGSKKIEGLALDMQMYLADIPSSNSNKVTLETNAFTGMRRLRLLQLSHVQLNGCYEEFPDGLRWLCWVKFPLESMPIDFPLESLVVLELQYSSLKRFWKGTKSLPSLKILDLSHSSGLSETADFSNFHNLEKLILVDCACLLDVHESICTLQKLVYLNIRDCKKIRKLPKNLSRLKLLETLIISGCSSLNEFPVDMRNMESLKKLEADEIPFNQVLATTGEVKSLLIHKTIHNFWDSVPCTLVNLSLADCNLFEDAFPRDLSNLSSLQRLDLSGNPICSLPDCVRDLRGLDHLVFWNCSSLKSLVALPGVRELDTSYCESLEKITFQSLSCFPKNIVLFGDGLKIVEIEYWYKMEAIGRVDEEMINLLGLCNLESIGAIRMFAFHIYDLDEATFVLPVQGVHEYGIFSTYIPGNETEVPGTFSYKIKGSSSLSFTVVLVPNLRFRGFNIFCVYYGERAQTLGTYDNIPPVIIQVCNNSKGLKWIYGPTCYGIPSDKKDVIWLSHWKFGVQQFEGGDEVAISVFTIRGIEVKEWGIQIVHEEEDNMSSQHNTSRDPCYDPAHDNEVIGNIGGELSDLYEVMPGIYFLYGGPFLLDHRYTYNNWKTQGYYNDFIEDSDKESAEEGKQGDGMLASTEEAEAETGINTFCGCKILVIQMLMSLVEICQNIG